MENLALQYHPGFHVWIFNHPKFYGVGDQLHFLFKYFKQFGANITCGNQPSLSRCNIVIENFDDSTVGIIKEFCMTHGKSIAIVLTEHVDIVRNDLIESYSEVRCHTSSVHLHGRSVNDDFSYLPLQTIQSRTNALLNLSDCTSIYFRLGDLPEMRGFNYLCHNRSVETLWFPHIEITMDMRQVSPEYDFVFIGARTPYRNLVLEQLARNNIKVLIPSPGISIKKRQQFYHNAKYCLNIPQDEEWPWLSPMRIISGLQAGVATISVGTDDKSEISVCTIQIAERDIRRYPIILKTFIDDKVDQTKNMIKRYALLASSSNVANFDKYISWAITDGLF